MDFAGEDVTGCTSAAQKYIKIMQSGYAPPCKTGLKLLNNMASTSSEEFNSKVYAKLDLVKMMEGRYKLSDPKLITQDKYYAVLGPVGLIAWSQQEHTQLVTDHEWPALAAKLPESNMAAPEAQLATPTYTSTVMGNCYRCGSKDHIRPDCTQPQKEG